MAGRKIKKQMYEDCIHLKACRRLCKLFKMKNGETFSRGCNKDTCSAYETKEGFAEDNEYTTVEDVLYDVRQGYYDYYYYQTD